MSLHKTLSLSLLFSISLLAASYHSNTTSSGNITKKIKNNFTIPKGIDHKSTYKPSKKKPKKIKKDQGTIASIG